MSVCILRQDGEVVLHRNMQAAPDPFRKAIAPYRDGLVVAVACLFPWDWRADWGAQEGLPLVLGHAWSMKASHGGTAKNETIAAQNIAGLLRGGMRPPASVYPAALRATRDLLRRRVPLTRHRAELLAHVHHTNSQSNLPEIGTKIAYQANRAGVAARFSAPAGQHSVDVDLALIDSSDRLRRDMEVTLLQTATQHDAPRLSRLQSVPGIGTMLRWVLLYAIHDLPRFPRVQDVVS